MDYTAALPVVIPAALALVAAGANHLVATYIVDDVDDCGQHFTATEAKHTRRSLRDFIKSVASPNKPVQSSFPARQPLR
jgi:hypothetical protein